MHSDDVQEVLGFLSSFLDAPEDQRIVQLESYPFFNREIRTSYIWKHDDLINLIELVCTATGEEPTASYFRKLRSEFVERLIDKGKNGRLTVENAAKLAVRFAGDDHRDHGDMIIAVAGWPPLSEEVKKITQMWTVVPYVRMVDANLREEPKCRTVLHQNQTTDKVIPIRSLEALEGAKRHLVGDFLHINVVENRDPRKFTDIPSAIVVKACQKPAYVLFPQEDQEVTRRLLVHISQHAVITRAVKDVRGLFKRADVKPAIKDLTEATIAWAGGRSHETVCSWIWGHRYCQITSVEWITHPLSEAQHFHLAYLMEMSEKAIDKIGPANMRNK